MRSRVVSAAQAPSEATISGLEKVTRSPAEMLENGPASAASAHSAVVDGPYPGAI